MGGALLTGRMVSGVTLTIRRPVQDIPTKPGTVIVANDGHKRIEAEVDGQVYYTREARLRPSGRWYAVWISPPGAWTVDRILIEPEHITPGTWKVGEK